MASEIVFNSCDILSQLFEIFPYPYISLLRGINQTCNEFGKEIISKLLKKNTQRIRPIMDILVTNYENSVTNNTLTCSHSALMRLNSVTRTIHMKGIHAIHIIDPFYFILNVDAGENMLRMTALLGLNKNTVNGVFKEVNEGYHNRCNYTKSLQVIRNFCYLKDPKMYTCVHLKSIASIKECKNYSKKLKGELYSMLRVPKKINFNIYRSGIFMKKNTVYILI